MSHILTVARMHWLDLRGRTVALVLLCALPPSFYFSRQLGVATPALEFRAGGFGIAWALACAALFSFLAAKDVDERLVLAGFRPRQLVLGRFLLFFVVSLCSGLVAWIYMSLGTPSDSRPMLAFGIALTAVVAVPLGLATAMILGQELEGTLIVIIVVGLQLSLQTDLALAKALPLYGPVKILELAANGEGSWFEPLVYALLNSVTLAWLGVSMWKARLPATILTDQSRMTSLRSTKSWIRTSILDARKYAFLAYVLLFATPMLQAGLAGNSCSDSTVPWSKFEQQVLMQLPITAGETVFYSVNRDGGFEKWNTADGWMHDDGKLTNDGSGTGRFVPAPVQRSDADNYAIEAEIQILTIDQASCRGSFGVAMQFNDGTGIATGLAYRVNSETDVQFRLATISDGIYSPSAGSISKVSPGKQRYVYRLEVRGSSAQMLVCDEHKNCEDLAISKTQQPGQWGLWSDGASVQVLRFEVTAL